SLHDALPIWTIRVPGDEHALPRTEAFVDFPAQLSGARFQLRNRRAALRRRGHQAQRFDFLQQYRDRFLEVHRLASHGPPRTCCRAHLSTTDPAPQTASTSRTNESLGRMRRAVAARTRSPCPFPGTSTTND